MVEGVAATLWVVAAGEDGAAAVAAAVVGGEEEGEELLLRLGLLLLPLPQREVARSPLLHL